MRVPIPVTILVIYDAICFLLLIVLNALGDASYCGTEEQGTYEHHESTWPIGPFSDIE